MVSHPDRELPPASHPPASGPEAAVSIASRLQTRAADPKLDSERPSGRSDGLTPLPPGQVTKPRRDGDSALGTQRSHNLSVSTIGGGMGPQPGQSYLKTIRPSGIHVVSERLILLPAAVRIQKYALLILS